MDESHHVARAGAIQRLGPPLPASPPPRPPIGEEDREPDAGVRVRRVLASLFRHKWLILGAWVVIAGAAIAVHKRFAPVYEAEAKVWITSPADDRQQTGAEPVRGAALLPNGSWTDLLLSYAVLGEVVHEMRLFVTPTDSMTAPLFATAEADETLRGGRYTLQLDGARYRLVSRTRPLGVVEQGVIGDSIGRAIGLRWAPPAAALAHRKALLFVLTTPREAARQLRLRIRTTSPQQGNLFSVIVKGNKAVPTAATANALVRQLVTTADRFKRRNLTDVSQTLQSQADYARTSLDQADDDLRSFRTQTITLPGEAVGGTAGAAIAGAPGGTAAIPTYFSLAAERDELRSERTALQQTLADVEAKTLPVSALWQVLPARAGAQNVMEVLQEYMKRESELRALQLQYTDEYAPVKDAKAAMERLRTEDIPRAVSAAAAQMQRREVQLTQQVDSASAGLHALPARTIEEMRRARNVEARSALYNLLRDRAEEARLAELSIEPDLAVLDSAGTPERPVANRGRQVMMLGLAGGLALAMLLALLLDRLDGRIRYIDEASKALRLPVLGGIPNASRVLRTSPDPLTAAQMVDAFRSLRLSVLYAMGEQPNPVMLTVTSASAGEGKSLVSANLAMSFAESGYRTLLIDSDVRRGSLHRTFAVERRPGLVDALVGTVPVSRVMHPGTHPRLTVIPCGSRRSTAPQLLTSQAFADLVDGVRGGFDAIVIDTPPLSAGVDAFALSALTGHAVIVSRIGKTNARFARGKLELLERLPVTVLGTVVNDIPTKAGLNSDYTYLPAYGYKPEDDELPFEEVPAHT